jgi:hypothetical protein
MEMVAEGVIAPCKHLGHVAVNPTFTAIVEGKEAKEVRAVLSARARPQSMLYSCLFIAQGSTALGPGFPVCDSYNR